MTHRYACSQKGEIDKTCDECRKLWESEVGVCAHCWKPVSNKSYFGLRANSPHITGKSAEKQTSIPAQWFDRRSTKPRHVITSYIATSNEAEEQIRAYRSTYKPRVTNVYGAPLEQAAIEPQIQNGDSDPRLAVIAALEAQNALLRQLPRGKQGSIQPPSTDCHTFYNPKY